MNSVFHVFVHLKQMISFILEAQIYKTREQYTPRERGCLDNSGYRHLGYLKIIFYDKKEISKWMKENSSDLSSQARLLTREFSGEYLHISAPYIQNVNMLISLASSPRTRISHRQSRVTNYSGYILEMQVDMKTLRGHLCKETGWCHYMYRNVIFESKKEAQKEVELIRLRDKKRVQEKFLEVGISWDEDADHSRIRHVVREYQGELRDVIFS